MSQASRQQELEALLQAFRLSAFRDHYVSSARQAEKERIDHVGYLYHLSKVEAERRYERKTRKLLKDSKLPEGKMLEAFEMERYPHIPPTVIAELKECCGLDRKENLIVIGNPGTGKTHLTVALAREWCLRGRKVLYTSAAALVQDLLAAKRDLKLNKRLKDLDKLDGILIDDLSYIPQSREETDVLFLLLSECYEQRTVVVTANLPFSRWGQVFKDPMTTMAAIDRLIHHSIILELNGPSIRVEQSLKDKEKRFTTPECIRSNNEPPAE